MTSTATISSDNTEDTINNSNNIDQTTGQTNTKIFSVHPSFRIIAVACPPSSSNPWMTDEVTSWFRTSVLSSPTRQDIVSMITQLHPNAPLETMNKALSFNELLETSSQRGTANEDKRAAGTIEKMFKV